MALPPELRVAIQGFWPEEEWEHAAAISNLESGWRLNARAYVTQDQVNDWNRLHPDDIRSVEDSRGPFQVNIYAHPWADAGRLLTDWAYASWAGRVVWLRAGGRWSPWFYSAKKLGLL